ncbi:jg8853, partial [Pararge aegeria aegeria]
MQFPPMNPNSNRPALKTWNQNTGVDAGAGCHGSRPADAARDARLAPCDPAG